MGYTFGMDVTALRGKVAELESELARKLGAQRRPLPRIVFLAPVVALLFGVWYGRARIRFEPEPIRSGVEARPPALERPADCDRHRAALDARVDACHRMPSGSHP